MSVYDPTAENGTVTTHDETTTAITRHVEPESQAITAGEPESYYRCEKCGTEAMRRRDLESEAHKAECSARGGR